MNKLYVVGIGPGTYEKMTIEAAKALEESDVIIGYNVYVDLIKENFPTKKFLSTPMKKEKERCIMAFEEAEKHQTVSMICSGDSGVYGMAGLIYQLSHKYENVEIHVVPGITAALSGASILGAPLTHDFCLISLSDLLTPMDLIEKRLHAAGSCDFVVCLYNPSSVKRHDYLKRACDILLQYKSEDTVCGIAKNIGRSGEETVLLSLKQLRDTQVDMFTTVFIGNSSTMKTGDKMVTPRGYKDV